MMLAIIIMIIVNVINAHIDSQRIKANKIIKHWLNGLLYISAFIGVILVFKIRPIKSVMLGFCWLSGRQIFFDISLNSFRGLKWYYVSLDKPPKAFIDRIEVKLWGYNGKAAVLVYGVAFVISTIIYLWI